MISRLEHGQTLAARHVLVRRLDVRDATELWLSREAESGEDEFLKIVLPGRAGSATARERLLRGARLQSELRHPNLLRCRDYHPEPLPFGAYPYLAEGDLSRLRGRPWRNLLPVLQGIAAGVEALHRHGLVHRDLKTSNVLLAEDGTPLVTDLGIAVPIGAQPAGSLGSPFSMSPQQLSGAPASVQDDAYSFGALAYELLCGYPPFYPDAAPERVMREAPPPLGARVQLPQRLERLVISCLAKDPADRPADFATLRRELAAVGSEAVESAPLERAAPRVELRPPESPPPAIQPEWRRPAGPAPGPEVFRRQGFRRGLVVASFIVLVATAAFVFLALPRWVEREAGAVAPTAPQANQVAQTAEPVAQEEQRDLQALARAKARYDELHPLLVERLAALEARGVSRWGGALHARAQGQLEAAESAAGELGYDRAVVALENASGELDALDALAARTLREAIAAGQVALDAGDAAGATAHFGTALLIDPASRVAKRGLERAGSLDEVRRLVGEARSLESEGRASAAAELYRQALRLDAEASDAREALRRIQAAAAADEFSRAVAQGLEALRRGDPTAARSAFEGAGRIRPDAAEVRDGLAAVERALGQSAIDSHLAAARDAESAERWQQALSEYRKALALDPRLLPAQQGLERTEPRAQLAAELEAYLSRSERLFSAAVRAAARQALQQARAVSPQGPVLARQIAELDALIASAETPVRVALTSDNATDVTVYRIGRLGAFERKELELLPGRYTVVGSRAGFRDVRQEITLLPGAAPATVSIRCSEPI